MVTKEKKPYISLTKEEAQRFYTEMLYKRVGHITKRVLEFINSEDEAMKIELGYAPNFTHLRKRFPKLKFFVRKLGEKLYGLFVVKKDKIKLKEIIE